MDQQLQTAISDLVSGHFFIPQKCAMCCSPTDLVDQVMSRSTSSSYTSGNTTTTTTTTNSITVKLCDPCQKKLKKAIRVTGGWRNFLGFICVAACGAVGYFALGHSSNWLGTLIAVGLSALVGGGVLFFFTVNWMIPNETRVTKKNLGLLRSANFDFTKKGEKSSFLNNTLVPVFASQEFSQAFDDVNPGLKFMKSISRVKYK